MPNIQIQVFVYKPQFHVQFSKQSLNEEYNSCQAITVLNLLIWYGLYFSKIRLRPCVKARLNKYIDIKVLPSILRKLGHFFGILSTQSLKENTKRSFNQPLLMGHNFRLEIDINCTDDQKAGSYDLLSMQSLKQNTNYYFNKSSSQTAWIIRIALFTSLCFKYPLRTIDEDMGKISMRDDIRNQAILEQNIETWLKIYQNLSFEKYNRNVA